MSSVNKVIIVGNLGRDPEVRSFANGGQVCNLRITTSETWKDKASGERKERSEEGVRMLAAMIVAGLAHV